MAKQDAKAEVRKNVQKVFSTHHYSTRGTSDQDFDYQFWFNDTPDKTEEYSADAQQDNLYLNRAHSKVGQVLSSI